MKKICKVFALVVYIVCFVYIMCLVGCVTKTNKNDHESGDSMREYYISEDFSSITVGESTFRDVYEIAPHESMQVTSYGGFCDYPLKNGGYIRIDFYGKDLIVGAVKEVS